MPKGVPDDLDEMLIMARAVEISVAELHRINQAPNAMEQISIALGLTSPRIGVNTAKSILVMVDESYPGLGVTDQQDLRDGILIAALIGVSIANGLAQARTEQRRTSRRRPR